MAFALHAASVGREANEAEQLVCDALWEVAGTDAYENLAWVVPMLQDGRPKVRRFALLAVKGLHPLCGLPAIEGIRASAAPHDFGSRADAPMGAWLAPRVHFERALESLLRSGDCNEAQLASSLARLPGEHERIARVLEDHATKKTRESYAHQWSIVSRVPQQLIIALTYRCNRKCPYCYAYESQDEIRGDIDVEHAEQALDWAVKQEVTLVSFTGGEPTCHPAFPRLVDAVAKRGMRLYLNTNGLFGKTVLDALSTPTVVDVGFHISSPELHRPAELPAIARNMDALRERGVDVFVRYTLWRATDDTLSWLVDFCNAHGILHLNLALGFPGRTATNGYLPSVQYQEVKPVLLRVLSLAADSGIRIRASKPIPLCLFSPREFAYFQRFHFLTSTCTVHRRSGVHNLVVNPDLSTYPCVGLPFRGPKITDADDYSPQIDHCGARIKLALRVVQSACHECLVYPTGVCQASCLGHCNDSKAAAFDGGGTT